MTASNSVPSQLTIAEASNIDVFDLNGDIVRFGTLFLYQKTIVVFIRHFFCGSCHQYVTALASVPQEALRKADTKIIVIGCGEWQPIRHVLETTNFYGQMYADPSRKLYRTFGMTMGSLKRAPVGTSRKSYIRYGCFYNALLSIWTGPLNKPVLIGKQGNLTQLGGDFVLGPGNQCAYASRMQHTEDHTEVDDLLEVVGVADS